MSDSLTITFQRESVPANGGTEHHVHCNECGEDTFTDAPMLSDGRDATEVLALRHAIDEHDTHRFFWTR